MFMSLLAAAGGTEDRSPWGDFWFNPVPMGGSRQVTADSAMRLAAVHACVRVRAEGVAMLPFTFYRRMPDGGRTFIRDHWIHRLFGVRPNRYQNPFEFRELMNAHLDLRGNAYAEIFSDGVGGVSDLIPIHPDRVKIVVLSNGDYRFDVTRLDGTVEPMNRARMFHLRGLSLDGITGLNPIAQHRELVGGAIAAQSYGMRLWENDARPGGWIQWEGKFADVEAKKRFREQWQENQTGANRGKLAVLEQGMTYHQVDLSNKDAQYVEGLKLTRSELASIFRVPPHMIGDLEKATFSNIEQQAIEFVTNCLTPLLVRWEEAIKFHFLDVELDPSQADLDIEFPTRELLRGDTKARSEYAASGIINGYLTRNEARLDDGREPKPGLDKFLVPLNMAEEGAAPPPANGSQKGPDNTPGGPKQPSRAHLRAERLARAAAARVARKEVAGVAKALASDPPTLHEFFEAHVRFVAQALAVDEDIAAAHCALASAAATRGTHSEAWAAAQLTRIALLVELTEEAA